jgi:hypothetical protein
MAVTTTRHPCLLICYDREFIIRKQSCEEAAVFNVPVRFGSPNILQIPAQRYREYYPGNHPYDMPCSDFPQFSANTGF